MEFDYNNIDNLLIKYKYVTVAKKSQTNKLLVKALLQRAVFDKLIELLKDFGSDTNLRTLNGSAIDPEFMKGQWKASAKDKLGAETVWAIETRFDGGGWATGTATDDEFNGFYRSPNQKHY
ncbi:10428_t:CDS:2 [Entrophospora sp. SA101]|nr:10428_t:CDS:2 [Entrophospora sp. SA101]